MAPALVSDVEHPFPQAPSPSMGEGWGGGGAAGSAPAGNIQPSPIRRRPFPPA
jgi:hypothetical protein